MKGESIILLALVALGGFLIYKASTETKPQTQGSGLGITQPGFGVNFGFSKFGN